ncbi:MAG: ribonuclease E activity regulator RraA [Pseudomonadota bacterium]
MIFKTADLSDKYEGKVQIVHPGFTNYGGHSCFYGKMVTVNADGDNSRIREQVNSDGQGKVLVIDNQASMSCAMLGDMLAAKAIENGWQGVFINGCIRDSVDISKMAIGVKAIGTNPLRSVKNDQGELDVEVEFAGACFRPGEYLYSDDDGVLLSAQALEF